VTPFQCALPVVAACALLASGLAARQRGADDAAPVRFTEVTRQAGIDFRHVNGASGHKHLVETMGSGGLFFDYDNDGWLDVFLVDGGSLADASVARQARHRLYRNRGNGRFEDATARSGIRHRGYGMGACAGDVDGDGDVDLYVTALGPDTLYRNTGGGAFLDDTATSGLGSPLWSASCAFADLDRDGDLDLWVTRYVKADASTTPFCGNARVRVRFYCHPLNYEPLPSALYWNNGRGIFRDASAETGVDTHASNGLGVVIADFDEDGWPDAFVANDSLPNFLFQNDGNGRFTEAGLRAGVAVAFDGKTRAGMGTDAGDYDGDGRFDLVITNLDLETHSLFRNLGGRLFTYTTVESGIAFPSLPFVGFGVAFLDVDHDGKLDLAVANGHIMDNAPLYRTGSVHAQRNLLFHNTSGRRFVEVGRSAGPGFALEKVSRGLAAGDIDNDGDLDLLITNNGQTADLLRHEGASGHALVIRTIGTTSNTDGVGAVLRVTAGGRTQVREVRAGSSYLGQHDPRVHVGLGGAASAERVEVLWPSGHKELVRDVRGGQIVVIREDSGLISRTPFNR
jgi:hypothetical protein